MPPTPPEHRTRTVEPALWVFGLACLVFASRARLLWANGQHGWLWPFGLWAAVILVGAVVNRRTD
jgi:hypothetical protein